MLSKQYLKSFGFMYMRIGMLAAIHIRIMFLLGNKKMLTDVDF